MRNSMKMSGKAAKSTDFNKSGLKFCIPALGELLLASLELPAT